MKPQCPIVLRGVRLRGLCVDCSGTPSGQLRLERGETLFHQGDAATHLFAVVEGWLRVAVTTADGHTCGARLVGPGHVLGLESFGPGAPTYHASCDALQRARICGAPVRQARAWLASHPEEALALTALSMEDLADLQRRLVQNASLSAEERVHELVKDLAAGVAPGTWYELPTTREQLGEVVGLTFETVSRMLHRLAERGLIEIAGRRVRIPPGA